MDYGKDNKWFTFSQVAQRLIKTRLLDETPTATFAKFGPEFDKKTRRWLNTRLLDETPCTYRLFFFLAVSSKLSLYLSSVCTSRCSSRFCLSLPHCAWQLKWQDATTEVLVARCHDGRADDCFARSRSVLATVTWYQRGPPAVVFFFAEGGRAVSTPQRQCSCDDLKASVHLACPTFNLMVKPKTSECIFDKSFNQPSSE